MRRLLSIVLSLAIIIGTFAFVPLSSVSAKTYDNRIETSFNNDWQFYRETYSGESKTQITAIEDVVGDDWRDVTLPHDFSIEGEFSTYATTNRSGCLQGGTGWYKKTFQVPTELSGKRFVINFDGVYCYSYVYVNGEYVGENRLGYVSYALDITDYLEFGFENYNEIVVKVANIVPSERWYSGSGIYRDVTMIVTNPVHVDYHGTAVNYPNLASSNGVDGTTDVTVKVKNESDADATVTVASTVKSGSEIIATAESSAFTVATGAKADATVSPKVTNPKLWSVDNPNLYTLVTEVKVDGTVVDTYTEQIGYKYTEYDGESGFFLNGKSMKLKGAALHNDFGAAIGTAAYDNAVKRYIDLLRDMGCNAIRTAHQPLSTNLMDYCARSGMMVFDEVFDEWLGTKLGDSNSYSFAGGISATNPLLLKEDMGGADVSAWSSATTVTWAEFGLKSTMTRDRNNPAVIIWGLGNELFEQSGVNTDAAKQKHVDAAKNLASWVKETDPQGRPCTVGDNRQETNSSGYARTYLDQVQTEMGLTGINYAVGGTWDYLYGVFPERAAFNTEGTDQCSNRGEYDHTKLINNGADDYEFTSYNNDDRGWANYLGEGWNLILDRDWFMGEFIWAGIDYLGEPCDYGGYKTGLKTPNTTFCGAYDSAGFAKDSMYFYRSIWNENSYTANMLPGTWNKDEVTVDSNGFVPVMVYSNADKVEVVLNGQVVGEATSTLVKTSSSDKTDYSRREWSVSVVDSSLCNSSKLVADTTVSDYTKLFVQMYVKYVEGTLELKSYKLVDGEYELITDAKGTQFVETTEGITDVKITQTATALTADKNDIVYYAVDAVDKDGEFVNGYNGKVTFTLEGEGEIIGADNGSSINIDRGCSSFVVSDDKKSATTSCYNGKCLLAVKATDTAGDFTVSATAYDETDGTTVVATKTAETVTTTADTTADEWEEIVEQHICADYTSVVTPATCEEEGYTTYTCTTCGLQTVGEFVDALGHTTDANGDCTVCGKNAKVLKINEIAEYVANNKVEQIKYEQISLDDVQADKAYAIAVQDGQNLYAFTSRMASYWPNNYTINYGFQSYDGAKTATPVASHIYGEQITEFDIDESVSNFYFEYDKEAGTVIISADVYGERTYFTFGAQDGNKINLGIKYTENKDEAIVFTVNAINTSGSVSLKTTYDSRTYYLCLRNCWYGKKLLLVNGNNNSFKIYEAVKNTDNASLIKLGNAITTVNDAVNANQALADTVYDNVLTAYSLYTKGEATAECATLANTLVTSTHTCKYVSNLKSVGYSVMKTATCKSEGETYYYCQVDGCTNYKIEYTAKSDHTYGTDVTVITPATCITAGAGTVACTVCGETKDVTINATGEHIYGDDGYCTADANCNASKFSVLIDGVAIAQQDDGTFVLPTSTDEGFVSYTDGTNYYDSGYVFENLTANVELTTITLSFDMLSGASMRLNSPTGIRFYSDVDTDLIETLRAQGAEISLGTIIAPEDKIGTKDFTMEIGTEGQDFVNVKFEASNWFTSGGFKGVVGSLANIKTANVNRQFVGRGYITIKFGSIEKTIYASYADSNIDNNARSICYIANKVMLNDYTTLTATHQEIVKYYADLYTGYDKYTTLDPADKDMFD